MTSVINYPRPVLLSLMLSYYGYESDNTEDWGSYQRVITLLSTAIYNVVIFPNRPEKRNWSRCLENKILFGIPPRMLTKR